MSTPAAHAVVAIAVLIGTALIFALVAVGAYIQERHRREAQAVELDALHRKEAHETDKVRIEGEPVDALDADLRRALKGPPPGGIVE